MQSVTAPGKLDGEFGIEGVETDRAFPFRVCDRAEELSVVRRLRDMGAAVQLGHELGILGEEDAGKVAQEVMQRKLQVLTVGVCRVLDGGRQVREGEKLVRTTEDVVLRGARDVQPPVEARQQPIRRPAEIRQSRGDALDEWRRVGDPYLWTRRHVLVPQTLTPRYRVGVILLVDVRPIH